MVSKTRSAEFEATLLFVDEPQIVSLTAGKAKRQLIAVAIPSDDINVSNFLATTVSKRDWAKYLDSIVDLRYLFTVPTIRILYNFDLGAIKNGKITLKRIDGQAPEDHLPPPRFFATNHSETYKFYEARASDPEQLLVDGEWELTDFGQFQQKFSDIYTFLISQKNWLSKDVPDESKRRILNAFRTRPYQGGFSYVHLFKDLGVNIPRSDQISLDKIRYASPGKVEIFGKDEIFSDLQVIIPNFVENRIELKEAYSYFYKYLSQNNFLKMRGDHYLAGDATEEFFFFQSEKLANMMQAPNIDVVRVLSNNNALVCAKIILAFYRRLEEASMYFSQGRVSYEDEASMYLSQVRVSYEDEA